MAFENLLAELLPGDLPHRDACVKKAAQHLALIVEINQQFNLTRIVEEREAVIKHVVDCLLPWKLFVGARRVVDAGTGAGFPGILLAVVFPEVQFTLIESTQKKARFVESAVEAMGLENVDVEPVRAEEWLTSHTVDVVTARAVAPLVKGVPLFAPALRKGARVLLYKGPDMDAEIAEAGHELRKRKATARVVMRYELPEEAGRRSVVEVVAG